MSSIRSRNTGPERVLGPLLWRSGLRYRKHVALIRGKPDFVFSGPRVAVFVDGDFWHGWQFWRWRHKLEPRYWRPKIAGNIARDKRNRAALRRSGWLVVRVWDHQLAASPEHVAAGVVAAVKRRLLEDPSRPRVCASSGRS